MQNKVVTARFFCPKHEVSNNGERSHSEYLTLDDIWAMDVLEADMT